MFTLLSQWWYRLGKDVKMKRRIVMFFAASLAAACARADNWKDPSTGYTWTYRITGGAAEIYNGNAAAIYPVPNGAVVVPATLGGKTVTSIGPHAFFNCRWLTSVTIPDSVTSIGTEVFSGCSGLEEITLPFVGARRGNSGSSDSVFGYIFGTTLYTGGTKIGQYYIPSKLKKVVVTDETVLGSDAFYGCSWLTSVTIPDSVTSIGEYAFHGCSGLTSVTIPDSVTSIGSAAFSGCSGLVEITLPFVGACRGYSGSSDSLFGYIFGTTQYTGGTKNGQYYIPSKLKKVVVTDETVLESSAFSGCSWLASVTIGSRVTSIGDYAFSGCRGLTSVTIPDSVTSIGDDAFYYCSGLTSVTIGNSVTSIGDHAFFGCGGLTSVMIPDSVTSIGKYTFSNCTNLTAVYVTDIGKWCEIPTHGFGDGGRYPSIYLNGSLLEGNLTIPYGVTRIGEDTFLGCSSGLTSVTIPDSVTSIGEYAFHGCSGLTSVTIPDSVTRIGSSAFSGCSGLVEITLPFVGARRGNSGSSDSLFGYIFGTSSYAGGTAREQYDSSTSSTFYYIPSNLKKVVVTDETALGYGAFYSCSGLTSVTIPSSVTSIGAHAFYSCSGLTSVTIPDSVTSIGDWAFSYCSGLTSVTIPDSVTSIWSYAFYRCSGLRSVTIPKSVTRIERSAFSDCSGLTSVTIPDSVTTIGEWAFDGCSGLKSVKIPYGVTSIGDSAFSGCINVVKATVPGWRCGIPFGKVKSLVISDGTSWIGDSAFSDCTEITSVTIPDSVTGIGTLAFDGCSGLTSVTIPDSVTSIGVSAFFRCSGLTSVTIPNSVTSIGKGAFSGCSGLQSITVSGDNPNYSSFNGMLFSKDKKTLLCGVNGNVTIPNDVTSIGYCAFYGYSGLSSVTIPDSVTSIGEAAFRGCSGLTSVTIPDGVTSINSRAFQGCSGLTDIAIPYSVTNIGDYAFSGCSGLKSVTIPDSVTTIGKWAFNGCSGLTSVTIPQSVCSKSFSDDVFNSCSSIRDVIISDSVTSIGISAFHYCSGLTSVSIPDSVMSIGIGAFDYCSGLTSVTIPASVTNIGGVAFRSCSGLKSITIPSSVTSIGIDAFDRCSGLTNVYVSIGDVDRIKRFMTGSGFDVSGVSFIEVSRVAFVANAENVNVRGRYVTLGHEVGELPYILRDGYLFAGWWTDPVDGTLITASTIVTGNLNCYAHWIPVSDTDPKWTIDADGVLTGVEDFNGCTDVVIPPGVTSIGNGAFSGCSRLTSVTIPYSVTSIGEGAFKDCAGLTTFIVDAANVKYKSVEGLLLSKDGTTLIAGVNKSEVVVPDSVTSIKPYAFAGCNKLASVTIPNSVTRIGSSAFSGCSELAEITLPFIGESRGGTGSTSLFGYIFGVLPYTGGIQTCQVYASNSSTSPYPDPYMYSAVYYIPSTLKNVTISDETVLGYGVFYGCSGLTSVTIPDSVTSVGERAFCGCSGLTSVTIPDSVTNIGDSAFSGCSGLESMTLPFVGNRRGDSGSSYALFGAIFGTSLYSGGKATKQYPSWTSSFSYTYYIPSSLKEVVITDETQFGYGAFYNCSGLTSVTIPDDVTSIGEKAFSGCSGLVSVTIPDSVASIGSEAFYNCSRLTSVTMKGSCPTVGSSAFSGVGSSCAAYLPRGNSTYSVADGKWYGLIVVYCDPVPAGPYTMTFDANGGIGGATETLDYGAALAAPTVTREGYTFAGWSPSVPASVPAANVTYTAQWQINQYTVAFDANGGTMAGDGTLTTNAWTLLSKGSDGTEEYRSPSIGNNTSTSMSLTLTGPSDLMFSWKVSSEISYDYLRWHLDGAEKSKISGTGGTWQNVSVSVPAGEHTIRWTYSKDSGGTGGSDCGWVRVPKILPTMLLDYGQTVGELPTPTREGYAFRGWWTAASGGTQVSASTKVTGNVTYYAHWVMKRTVTFDANGGSLDESSPTKSAVEGTEIGTLPTPKRTGYTFDGWWTSATGGVQISASTIVTGDLTCYAHWLANKYAVTFDANGGDVNESSRSVTFGNVFGELPTPTRTGYVFKGWWTATGTQISASTVVTGDMALYAHWADSCMVTFDANGGSVDESSRSVESGSAVGTLPIASRTGYSFAGWWTTASGGVQISASTKITEAVTYYAHWSCAVTFNANGGSVNESSRRVVSGSAVGLLPTPARSGYIFDGWFTAQSGGTQISASTIISGPITYYAHWTWTDKPILTIDSTGALTAVDLNGYTDIVIPDGVTRIESFAFKGCSNLTSVTIPDSVMRIGASAFYGCGALEKISLPFVGARRGNTGDDDSFFGYIFGPSPYTGGTSTIQYDGSCSACYYIPSNLRSVAVTDENILGAGVFYGCKGLTSVMIPNSVTSIGVCAFYGCSGLTSVTIPDSVTSIGSYAFYGCSELTSVTIPDSVTSIGDDAFGYCSGLTSVTIPDSVTSFGANVFSGCSGIREVVVPQYLCTNGLRMLFSQYQSITNVFISDCVTSIGSYAFYDCSGLRSVKIPDSVTSIGERAFSGCSGLTSVTIPDSVTSIGDSAFSGCSGLTSVTIPDCVTSIGDYAFYGCNGLTSVYVPFGDADRVKGLLKSSRFDVKKVNFIELGAAYVAFNANGGVVAEQSRKVAVDDQVGELPMPTRTGHTFTGWFTAANGGTEVSASKVVTENVTCYAHWTVNKYTVTFDENGGVGGKTVTQNYGTALAAPTVARTGYMFAGWSPAAPAKVPAGNATYVAQWTKDKYMVTFNANGGAGGWSKSMDYGAAIAAPTVTRAGYTFAGWSPAVSKTVPIGGACYTAQWTIHRHQIRLALNGGEGVGSVTVDYGTRVGDLPVPTRDGYEFLGWFTAPRGGSRIADNAIVTGDMTIYAQWHTVLLELYELIDGAAPAAAASEYNGYLYDEKSGAVKGTIQVKVGKPNVKTGLATIKATVVVGTKKVTLKGVEKGKSVLSSDGPTELALVGGESCEIVLGAEGISGYYGECVIDGSRNFFTSKDKAEQRAVNDILAKWLGSFMVIWDGGSLSVNIAAKGKVKVSGTLADGKTKVSASTVLLVGEEWSCVSVAAQKANLVFVLWLSHDGQTIEAEGLGDNVHVGLPGTLANGATFQIDADEFAAVFGQTMLPYLPDGVPVTQKGTKWTLPKAGKVVYKNGALDESKLGDNPCGLKLTYKSKDGTFKGSFKAYAEVKGKPKATTVNVTGFMLNGVGYGTATIKKVGSVPILIE